MKNLNKPKLRRFVKSARFLVEDENGFVIGEADTYEEAQTLNGVNIIDTQNQQELSQSKKSIKSDYHDYEDESAWTKDAEERLRAQYADEHGLNLNEDLIDEDDFNEWVHRGAAMYSSKQLIKSGPGAGYHVTIRGIELDNTKYKIISDDITNEEYNEHTTVIEVPVKPCVAEYWEAMGYYDGIDSTWTYYDPNEDSKIEGGKANIKIYWTQKEEGRFINNPEFENVEEAIEHYIPSSIDIKVLVGGGYFHSNLPVESVRFEDEVMHYGIDENNDGWGYETESVDLICPNICDDINNFFKNPEEYYDDFYQFDITNSHKKSLKSGYSNNSDYFGDWFGKGQIDYSKIINPEEDGDLYLVKMWCGSGYVLDTYLVKAYDTQDAIDKVLEWSYENEGENNIVFSFEYLRDEAHKNYEEYPDYFGEPLSEEDFEDKWFEDMVYNSDYSLFARDENFFVSKVPDNIANTEIESSAFAKNLVEEIISNKITEDGAARIVARKMNYNEGYAKQIVSKWIEDNKSDLIQSGILDVANDINRPFDIDGDLDSWFEEFVGNNSSGKANTVGGEIVRALNNILYEFNNNGNKIGIGSGKETCNGAARYLMKMIDTPWNEDLNNMLEGNSEINRDDNDYEYWLTRRYIPEVEDYLRNDAGQLFQTPNKDDYEVYQSEDDSHSVPEEITVVNNNGDEWTFSHQGTETWRCENISCAGALYEVGDTFIENDEGADEFDHTDEYPDFTYDGYFYSCEPVDDMDDDGEYHEWEITQVEPEDNIGEEGYEYDTYEIISFMNDGYDVFAEGGTPISDEDELSE